jgi:hypothetical protein
VLLRDFFHSFAISSLLFFESLFAIDTAEALASWTIKDGGCRGRNGKNRRLEGKGRVKIMGVVLSLYRQQLHPFHFPHSWEVSGPSGGCGVLVFNNYRQLMWWFSCTIDVFLFLNHTKSGCTVTRRTFSRSRLTIRQDASSHHALMWQDALSKRTSRIGGGLCMTFLGTAPTTEHYKLGDWSTSLPVWIPGDCTDHRAL